MSEIWAFIIVMLVALLYMVYVVWWIASDTV